MKTTQHKLTKGKAHTTYIFLNGLQHQGFELRQAAVDTGSAALLHQRFLVLHTVKVKHRQSPAIEPRLTTVSHQPQYEG